VSLSVPQSYPDVTEAEVLRGGDIPRPDRTITALDLGQLGAGAALRGGLRRGRGANRHSGTGADERSPGCPHRDPRVHGPMIVATLARSGPAGRVAPTARGKHSTPRSPRAAGTATASESHRCTSAVGSKRNPSCATGRCSRNPHSQAAARRVVAEANITAPRCPAGSRHNPASSPDFANITPVMCRFYDPKPLYRRSFWKIQLRPIGR
jgi:hypothetical protein